MDLQANARLGPGHDRDMVDIGAAGNDVDPGLDVAGSHRVDGRPGLLPGWRQRLAEIVIERQVLSLDLQVDLERRIPVREHGPDELLDPAIARDGRLAVPPAHVLEFPQVRVELETTRQVADRVGEARPGDLAPGIEVEIGIDDQVPLGLRPGPDHGPGATRTWALTEPAGWN